jgi:hypothetical protein
MSDAPSARDPSLHPLTRRGLLGAAAAAGAGVLGRRAAVADAAPEGGGTVFAVDVGALSGASPEIAAARPFALAGVEWSGPRAARIELRARSRDGLWSRWALASGVHGPDGGLERGTSIGDPVWTGPAHRVQLRTSVPVSRVRVHFVAAVVPGIGTTADAAAAPPLASPVLAAGPGQPPIIARRAWAHGHGPKLGPFYGDVRLAFVHHTVGANGYGAAQVPGIILGIYQYHRFVKGWFDIGYNFVIDAFGRIWEARAGGIDMPVMGAQAGGYNLESTGIAMLGTFTGVVPPPAAMAALERLLAWKLSLHGLPTSGHVTVEVDPSDAFYTPFKPGAHVSLPRIAGHRDGCSTDCPGNALYRRLPAVRSAVTLLTGEPARVTLAIGGYTLVFGADYLTPAGTTILAGMSVPLSGTLTTLSGVPIAGAPVEVQQLTGAGVTATVATAITGADGVWSATVLPTEDVLLRALHRPAPATASPFVYVDLAPVLTLRLVSSAPLVVAGTVTPGKRRVEIVVYRLRPGRRRKRVVLRRVGAVNGAFQTTLRLRPGNYVVQAQAPADSRTVAGVSPALDVTV